MSPTQRSLRRLRAAGYTAAVVERWNPGARVRVDLFGFIDIVAIYAGKTGVVGVQSTTTDNQSKRLAKIASEPVATKARAWLLCGNTIIVEGWSKKGPRGKRKLWESSRTSVVYDDASPTKLAARRADTKTGGTDSVALTAPSVVTPDAAVEPGAE
jgi:hypothetical protein